MKEERGRMMEIANVIRGIVKALHRPRQRERCEMDGEAREGTG